MLGLGPAQGTAQAPAVGASLQVMGPWLDAAHELALFEVDRIAREVGGGECSPAVSSIVQSACLATAASRYLYATSNGDAKALAAAGRLAESARQHSLAAHELAVREAKARPKLNELDALSARLGLTPRGAT